MYKFYPMNKKNQPYPLDLCRSRQRHIGQLSLACFFSFHFIFLRIGHSKVQTELSPRPLAGRGEALPQLLQCTCFFVFWICSHREHLYLQFVYVKRWIFDTVGKDTIPLALGTFLLKLWQDWPFTTDLVLILVSNHQIAQTNSNYL